MYRSGTFFALSADKIMMNYFFHLDPINSQIVKDDNLAAEDFSENPELDEAIKKHYELLRGYLNGTYIH